MCGAYRTGTQIDELTGQWGGGGGGIKNRLQNLKSLRASINVHIVGTGEEKYLDVKQ